MTIETNDRPETGEKNELLENEDDILGELFNDKLANQNHRNMHTQYELEQESFSNEDLNAED